MEILEDNIRAFIYQYKEGKLNIVKKILTETETQETAENTEQHEATENAEQDQGHNEENQNEAD